MKKLSKSEEQALSPEEYEAYYYYLRDSFEKSKINNLTIQQRKKLHSLLLNIIKIRNKLNGYRLHILSDEREVTNKPVIYAITHIGKADIEVVSQAIGDHYYLLCGDFESLHDTVDGFFLGINGVLYFNEHNKQDRNNVKDRMIEVLNSGGNIMYFPEGTWNLSANLPMLPCYYGIIEVAKKANVEIIPVAIEQYDNNFIVKIGKNFKTSNIDTKEQKIIEINQLRDIMATLKWEIWESVDPLVRSELPDGYYDTFIENKIGEWPTLSLTDFQNAIFKNKNIVSPEEVYQFLYAMKINKKNEFLFMPKDDYVKKLNK